MKLSRTQEEVLTLMKAGWELGSSMTIDARARLQKGGIGYGGEVKDISLATLRVLCSKNLIRVKSRHFPSCLWELT